MRISAVVPAYNEEKNIRRLLASLAGQKIAGGTLIEIIVVASGCTDRTHAEVGAFAKEDPRVRLLVQDARLGKVAALNAYLRERDPSADVLVICSADLLVQPGCLELFADALARDPRLGMVGGRPVPTNPRGTLMGNIVGYMWDLHHELARQTPKLGEIVAVRAALVSSLPEDSAVDEASIEARVTQQGFVLKYLPEAIVANRGPNNIREFMRQRRRIAAGHFWLRETSGYEVSTLDWRRIVKIAVRRFTLTNPHTDGSYLVAMGLEAIARGLGYLDWKRNHSHAVWEVSPSTRQVSQEDVPPTVASPRKARRG